MIYSIKIEFYVTSNGSGGSRISKVEGGGGTNPRGRDINLLFGKIFAENCMKMKEI